MKLQGLLSVLVGLGVALASFIFFVYTATAQVLPEYLYYPNYALEPPSYQPNMALCGSFLFMVVGMVSGFMLMYVGVMEPREVEEKK